jgi:hypothetical protein
MVELKKTLDDMTPDELMANLAVYMKMTSLMAVRLFQVDDAVPDTAEVSPESFGRILDYYHGLALQDLTESGELEQEKKDET